MPQPTRRQYRVILLSAAGIAIGLGVIVHVCQFVLEQPRFFRPPTQVLAGDQEWYDNVFDPAKRIAMPDLLSHPEPLTPVSYDPPESSHPAEVTITCKRPASLSISQLYELFATDDSGAVTMPDGNQLRLSAVALMLPSDVEWQPDEEPADKVPVWIDPRTGAELAFDPNDEEWTKPRSVPTNRPRLHFRIEVEGDAPIRWRVPEIHDAQSRRSIGAVFSSDSIQGDGFFAMDLKTWHQTGLDIGINLAFGTPEIKTLPITKNAELRFGDAAIVKVLEVFPNSYRYMRMKENNTVFTLNSKPQRSGSRAAAVHQWPPQQSLQIEFQPFANSEPKRVFGLVGVGGLKWKDKSPNISEMTVYRYPHMGRAVFHLPVIPRLPEVDNLIKVPISRIRVKYPGNFVRYAADAAEVDDRFSFKSSDLSDAAFPLFLDDTTPEEIIDRFENLSGMRLYYDKQAALLSDQKPPTLLERWEVWWRKHRPIWLR